jgi:hypothetical protein
LINTPVSTNITYSSPTITIGTAGVYQVTYGAAASSGTTPFLQLSVNSSLVSQSGLEVPVLKDMRTTTVILSLAANSTLQVLNEASGSVTLNVTLNSGPTAFMSITKI